MSTCNQPFLSSTFDGFAKERGIRPNETKLSHGYRDRGPKCELKVLIMENVIA